MDKEICIIILYYSVSDVYVSGKQLLKNRELTTINPYKLFELSQKWVKRLRAFEKAK